MRRQLHVHLVEKLNESLDAACFEDEVEVLKGMTLERVSALL